MENIRFPIYNPPAIIILNNENCLRKCDLHKINARRRILVSVSASVLLLNCNHAVTQV